jgi:Fe-S cluster assembly scaffold protein SufB
MADGATYVEVPARTHREDPIVLATGDDAPFASAGVIVREGASATICLTASGTATSAAEKSAPAPTTGSALRVICERDASVDIVEIVASPDGHQHLEAIGIDCAERASAVVRQFALGGAKVAMGLAVNLAGDSSRFELANRYVVRGADLLDVNHVVRQRGRNTTSDLSATGVLLDEATKTMRETIDLVHGAKNSRGNELECVLVCGDGVTNKTLPTILCDEEDVAGNHGATIGAISPDQLAYMQNRGLTEDEAVALFMRSIFDDALIHAPEAISSAAVTLRAEAVLGSEVSRDSLEALDVDLFADAEV